MLKRALISLKYFRPLWVKLLKKKKKIILNDRVFYFLSTAIVILIVIVIRINHHDIRRMKFPDKTFSNFNHSLKAINSLITQSACVYLDLLPHVKRMSTEIHTC